LSYGHFICFQWFGFYKPGQAKEKYTLQESQLYKDVSILWLFSIIQLEIICQGFSRDNDKIGLSSSWARSAPLQNAVASFSSELLVSDQTPKLQFNDLQ